MRNNDFVRNNGTDGGGSLSSDMSSSSFGSWFKGLIAISCNNLHCCFE